jgi:hypothetical protein
MTLNFYVLHQKAYFSTPVNMKSLILKTDINHIRKLFAEHSRQ